MHIREIVRWACWLRESVNCFVVIVFCCCCCCFVCEGMSLKSFFVPVCIEERGGGGKLNKMIIGNNSKQFSKKNLHS